MKTFVTALTLILVSLGAIADAPSDQDRLKKLNEMQLKY